MRNTFQKMKYQNLILLTCLASSEVVHSNEIYECHYRERVATCDGFMSRNADCQVGGVSTNSLKLKLNREDKVVEHYLFDDDAPEYRSFLPYEKVGNAIHFSQPYNFKTGEVMLNHRNTPLPLNTQYRFDLKTLELFFSWVGGNRPDPYYGKAFPDRSIKGSMGFGLGRCEKN